MIFETLHESSEKGELMLVDGGMCHWHLRRDGQLTIREIISTHRGAGSLMLNRLRWIPGATSLFAKCPADLAANEWYSRRGFVLERIEETKTGRKLHCWRLMLARWWQPNAGHREIIYCADGNKRAAETALDRGLRYGARLPGTVYYRPYFVDQDWRKPDRASYMTALKEYRPWMATVLDWESDDQLPEVLSWAREAAQYVQVVVIIPKVIGGVHRLPRKVGGKPIRLGYSVPTQYAGTQVPTAEFRGWPVHLLGGDPARLLDYTLHVNVWSMDTNYHNKMAMERNQFYSPRDSRGARYEWPTLQEAGGSPTFDAPYEAFARSCQAIMQQWRTMAALESKAQMILPFAEANQ